MGWRRDEKGEGLGGRTGSGSTALPSRVKLCPRGKTSVPSRVRARTPKACLGAFDAGGFARVIITKQRTIQRDSAGRCGTGGARIGRGGVFWRWRQDCV